MGDGDGERRGRGARERGGKGRRLHLRDAALLLLESPLLRLLEPLRLGELGVADLLEVLLVGAHVCELLLLHHLHHTLLQRLAHKHLRASRARTGGVSHRTTRFPPGMGVAPSQLQVWGGGEARTSRIGSTSASKSKRSPS